MQIHDIPPISGAITYWSLAQGTSLRDLAASLQTLDLLQFLPEPQSPESALHSALVGLFGGRRQLIRPLERRNGFAVVNETPYADVISYSQETTVKVDPLTEEITLTMDRDDKADQIKARYWVQRRAATAKHVSKMLIQILEHLGALCLRPKGGVYWIHDAALPVYARVAEAIEQAHSFGKESDIYCVRTALDLKGIQAVSDALKHEVENTIEEITAEVVNDERAVRRSTLKDRQARLGKLREKIAMYEAILGTTFETLHAATETAENLEAFDEVREFGKAFVTVEA